MSKSNINSKPTLGFSGPFPCTPGVTFLSAKIANALESAMQDGVVCDAKSVYDSAFESVLTDLEIHGGAFQAEINKLVQKLRDTVFPITRYVKRLDIPLGDYYVASQPQEMRKGYYFLLPSNDDQRAVLNEAGVPIISARGGEDLCWEVPTDGKYYVGSRRPDAYEYGIQSILGGSGSAPIDVRAIIEQTINESSAIKVVNDTYIVPAYTPKDFKFEEVFTISSNFITSLQPNPAYARLDFQNANNVTVDTATKAFKVRDLAPSVEASVDIVYLKSTGEELHRKHITFRPQLPCGYAVLPKDAPVTALTEPTNCLESLYNVSAKVRIPDDQLYKIFFVCDRLADIPDTLLCGGVAMYVRRVPSIEIPARLAEYAIFEVGSTYQGKTLLIQSPAQPSANI